MIRVNLLGLERQKVKKPLLAFDPRQSVTVVSALILVATVAGVAWWFWSLRQESARLDAEIAAAQQESARLQALLGEVRQFEAQQARLQERVALIEQLRRGQSIPVQLLDHISKSVPDMLWLTAMNQDATTVTLEGRSTTLIALSDFVGNLASNDLLRKPIEIVNSQVQPATTGQNPAPELIAFTVRAQINIPAAPEPPAESGRGARGARGAGARGGARGAAAPAGRGAGAD
jgi:type IV pilus assembly protein PilN